MTGPETSAAPELELPDPTDFASTGIAEGTDPEAIEASEAPEGLVLDQYPEQLRVVRLAPGAEVPEWAESSSIFSITATATETSLICAGRSVPKKAQQQGPFTAFAVQGPLDFALVGVLHRLLGPMVEEGISVLSFSTYDTDWILVPKGRDKDAAAAWRRSGHTVAPARPVR